jgi:hypothetical protein
LKETDDSWHHAEDSRFLWRADCLRRGRTGEQASVAGSSRRAKESGLPLKLKHGSVRIRDAEGESNVVEHVPRFEVVGTVHEDVVVGRETLGLASRKAQRVGFDADERVEIAEPALRSLCLGTSYIPHSVEYLPLQI